MLPFTYVCFWKCCTSIKALFFLFTKFHNTKLRSVPHGTVRKVRLVCIFITRTNVPYPYLSNNYVPYKRTVLFAEKWSVPYRTCVPYRTVLPSLLEGLNAVKLQPTSRRKNQSTLCTRLIFRQSPSTFRFEYEYFLRLKVLGKLRVRVGYSEKLYSNAVLEYSITASW